MIKLFFTIPLSFFYIPAYYLSHALKLKDRENMPTPIEFITGGENEC